MLQVGILKSIGSNCNYSFKFIKWYYPFLFLRHKTTSMWTIIDSLTNVLRNLIRKRPTTMIFRIYISCKTY